jgi:hypothetical protein
MPQLYDYWEPPLQQTVRSTVIKPSGSRRRQTSRMRRYLGATVLAFSASAIALSACYVHTRAHMIGPVIKRPAVCPAAVRFFDADGDLGDPYVEVARLSVWWPADMVARVSDVERAVRKKAAQLGANGLIRGRLAGSDSVQPRYEGDVAGVAIFLPGDSARAAACAPTPADAAR